jgi:SWI/SNF-related matrix-associated actin-dependent regulator 1 of chromatin subfamily A
MALNFNSFLPEGVDLYDYQHVGVALALYNTADGKGTWLADEQGLGKTRQAITVALVKGCKKILVVCKSALKANWEREINQCAPQWTTQVLGGTRPYETMAQCVIISFDLLATWSDALLFDGFDALIIDESHYVKSKGTARQPVQRTMAALKIGEQLRARKGLILLLSGTPLLNRPVELVTQLELMGRLEEISPTPRRANPTAKDWEYAFKFSFCGAHNNGHGWEFKGSSNLDLLNTRARSRCLIRRLRTEVLDMSETHRIQTPLSLNGGLDEYRRIERNFVAKNDQSYYLELMNALRQAAGLAKVDAAVDWINTYLEENPDKKLVVWAWHIPVQREIARKVKGAIYFKGEQDKGRVEEAKAQFNTGDARVIVCSLQAHREGHTLVGDGHNVTDCLFVESPWHPGAVSQAEDRINRIGRKADAVFATTLTVPNTIDQELADLIAEKWDTFRGAVDGTVPEGAEDDIQAILMARLRARKAQEAQEGGEAS